MPGYMRDLGNGKIQFEVSNGFDGKCKRDKKYGTITAKGSTPEARRKYAEKQLALFVAEVETGQYQDRSKYTFASYVDEWKRKLNVSWCQKHFTAIWNYSARGLSLPSVTKSSIKSIPSCWITSMRNYGSLRKE